MGQNESISSVSGDISVLNVALMLLVSGFATQVIEVKLGDM